MTLAATEIDGRDLRIHVPRCKEKQWRSPTSSSLRLEGRNRKVDIMHRKNEMADRVCNISDIIHRVASSCLTQPLAGAATGQFMNGDDDEEQREEMDSDKGLGIWEEEEVGEHRGTAMGLLNKLGEMEAFMIEVFNAASAVKKAYVGLQEAHCPWDPDRIRVADAGVVAELRKLVRLRDRFRREISGVGGGDGGGRRVGRVPIREVVAPYEAALEDLRREIKFKESEIENLKEKLVRSGRAGRTHSSKRVGCISGLGSPVAPTPELFESCMDQVKSASKSFTTHLLSLMRVARWDLAAAARSIIDGGGGGADSPTGDQPPPTYIPEVEPRHARHALESYVNRKLFHGFENETFYLEGSLSSLLRPAEFRQGCFSQFRDMRAMEPAELLGILPTCQFGRFAGKKYLAVMHPKMEDSFFGGSEQRLVVIAGGHPRTGFYGEFLRLAKAVWLLHLLAFALDPAPCHFEASKGAEFHEEYMESVVKFSGGRKAPEGAVVGFSVAPGFKLGNGSVVRARVFVVPWEKTSQVRGKGVTD
ncbi:uncharacterized protein LOC110022124 isoform X2 [Phalaenopsis equestris]|nr:uncharacterized protein LOC110022124 isoform X2 [Phalaenopsis equestris]